VVDDHSLNGELTSLLLGQMGVGVKLATTGTEGFHMAAEARYDLILMDLDLPDMDGFETTRRIRQSGMNQDRPIVALTAHALSTHRSKCLEAGMNDCITKPINPDLFYGVISRWAPETIQPTLPRDPADMEVVAGNEFLGTLGRLSPLVDVDLALKRLGGRADLLIRFLKQFADDPFDADTIRESMLSGKTKEAASIAHDIKGMSNTLAITRMAEAATQLERCLRGQEEGPWEEPCQRLWDAMTEFRATMAYLD
jgi:CheY-like chemotaxis protein